MGAALTTLERTLALPVRLLARCVRGLEWIAADEIAGLSPNPDEVRMAAREVGFELPALARWLTDLGTVDDLFIRVGAAHDVGTTKDVPPALANHLARLDWVGWVNQLRELRPVPDRPQFDVVASLDGRRSYNRFAVENALGPMLASQLHGSYLARTAEGRSAGEPDLTVRVLVQGAGAVAALRLGNRPQHRRPYKQDTGAGTLHPPVAAGLARLVAPVAQDRILDPFCGDGTIAVETALAYPTARVSASDIDAGRLANARHNAQRAGVSITFTEADAARIPAEERSVSAIITNPPWNVAVDARGALSESLARFWRAVPAVLDEDGRVCLIADLDLDAPGQLRRLGYQVTLASQIRLAGRVSHVILCAPPDAPTPRLQAGLHVWRNQALRTGVVTEEGF